MKKERSLGRLVSWIGCILTVFALCGVLIINYISNDPGRGNWEDWLGKVICAAVVGFPLLVLGIAMMILEKKTPQPRHGLGKRER